MTSVRPCWGAVAAMIDSVGDAERTSLGPSPDVRIHRDGLEEAKEFVFTSIISLSVGRDNRETMGNFKAVNSAFDPIGLAQVRFVFDRTRVGGAQDDIGFHD